MEEGEQLKRKREGKKKVRIKEEREKERAAVPKGGISNSSCDGLTWLLPDCLAW